MKPRLRSYLVTALALACFSSAAIAQATPAARTDEAKKAYKSAMEQADQKIAAEVQAHSELIKNLGVPDNRDRPEAYRIKADAVGQRLDAQALSRLWH
jgi:Skp family chaperone for outer membrane proteins